MVTQLCLALTHTHTARPSPTLRFHDDSVQLFNTLPDIPTGGNLTMTIIAELFKTERVQRATDVYINFDGASDNICYHVFYGLAWLLHSARQAGWPLRCIHILRFKVLKQYHPCILALTHSRHYLPSLFAVGGTHTQSIRRHVWAVVSPRVRQAVWGDHSM